MKVGLIGLGRMGEGMSRRMIARGNIEVWGYRNNYAKAERRVILVDVPLLWKALFK
jgi:6-phosphogluconate dehydrogenase